MYDFFFVITHRSTALPTLISDLLQLAHARPKHALHAPSIYLLSLTWELDRSFSTRSPVHPGQLYTLQTGRAARVLTISDHVMYNFRTSTWVNLVTPYWLQGLR